MFKNKFLIIGVIVLFFGILITTAIISFRQRVEVASFKPVTLEYWGVWEEPSDIRILTDAYSSRHPLVTIKYRSFRAEEYRNKLLEGWATDQGPDIFMIPSNWIREYQKFTTPMPSIMQVPAQILQGTIKQEVVDIVQTYSGYTPKNIRDLYLDVVYRDVVIDDQVFGLPMSVDTMALFYNRSLLINSGIPLPATTWTDIVNQAAKISKLDQTENLLQSAVALGSTNNIPNAFDIISLLMMQSGVQMERGNTVYFGGQSNSLNAINFYLSFSQPNTISYSWNDKQSSALDVFTAGKLAYFLGYSYHIPTITKTNPKLDYDILPVPQLEGSNRPVTYANYWVNVVAKKSQYHELAWQFIKEITAAETVKTYLDETQRTTALLSLVESQKANVNIEPFARLLLQSTNWYNGYDFPTAQKIFLDMIDDLKLGEEPSATIINSAVNRISQTYRSSR